MDWLVCTAVTLMKKFNFDQAATFPKIFAAAATGVQSSISKKNQSTPHWIVPAVGSWNLNTYALVGADLKCCGFGGVIRERTGCFVAGFSSFVVGCLGVMAVG